MVRHPGTCNEIKGKPTPTVPVYKMDDILAATTWRRDCKKRISSEY